MSKFQVGDWIIQQHQQGAHPRLVIGLTDDPVIVRVYCPDSVGGYRRVHVWSHDLYAPANVKSQGAVEEHLVSEAYAKVAVKPWW